MCGIAGIYCKKKAYEKDSNLIKKMTDAMAHRGPDAEGLWSEGKVALGHRRLSIIDLSENGNQPMISHDGRYIISFNGEIYNYIEIKKDLKRKGAIFRTDTDTEVVIEAYRYYGVDCFKLFNGMWGVGLLDIDQGRIILSRDRFGIKPLYTSNDDNYLVFASEVKAIIAAFPQKATPNNEMIYRYLTGSQNEDTDEQCFYHDIRVFPPAHYMVVDLNSKDAHYERYWDIDVEAFRKRWIAGKNPYKVFRLLFEDSIALRLRADVEVGACLSGGLDSSAIVGCMAKKYKRKVHTFSSIYDDKNCNEEAFVMVVNKKWNTEAHYIRPDLDEQELPNYLRRIIYFHDQPCNGASLYSQFKVMECIHDNVKVVLDGQGADELFAGYLPYYSYYFRDLLDKGTKLARIKALRMLLKIEKRWPQIMDMISSDIIVRIVGLGNVDLMQREGDVKERRIARSSALFSDSFLRNIDGTLNKASNVEGVSKLNNKLCREVTRDSLPSLLHNEDGDSMAFSVESRVPFLDYRIVEFALALDGKYKLHGLWTKWIIRRALKQYLPDKIAKRKDKMGFPAPFSRWLRDGKSKEELKRCIYDFANREIVPLETIDTLYKSHIEEKADNGSLLFKFFALETWFKMLEKGEMC